jgi:aminoglycoside phosphotransferase (APT) family kinase protein
MVTDEDVLALVDPKRLRAYLETVVTLDGALDIQVLSGGRSNLTYLVSSGLREYVLRRRPIGEVAPGAHDMSREHRVLAALDASGLPTPSVYGYCEEEAIVGAPFYVMERVEGTAFHRRSDVEELSANEARAVSEATVDVLERLHRVDYEAVGLGQLGRPEGFIARRIERWLEQWRRSEHRDHALLEPIAKQLCEALPSQCDSTLVHGDYRLGNMLVDVGTPQKVTAVLDWEMSTLGDPLTDLAHLLVYWDRTRGRLTHESQTIAEHPGFLHSTELATRYAERSGRDLDHLDFYLAFEHWRAAIIKEAIYVRTRRGDHPGTDGDSLGETVSLHLEEAADILGAS